MRWLKSITVLGLFFVLASQLQNVLGEIEDVLVDKEMLEQFIQSISNFLTNSPVFNPEDGADIAAMGETIKKNLEKIRGSRKSEERKIKALKAAFYAGLADLVGTNKEDLSGKSAAVIVAMQQGFKALGLKADYNAIHEMSELIDMVSKQTEEEQNSQAKSESSDGSESVSKDNTVKYDSSLPSAVQSSSSEVSTDTASGSTYASSNQPTLNGYNQQPQNTASYSKSSDYNYAQGWNYDTGSYSNSAGNAYYPSYTGNTYNSDSTANAFNSGSGGSASYPAYTSNTYKSGYGDYNYGSSQSTYSSGSVPTTGTSGYQSEYISPSNAGLQEYNKSPAINADSSTTAIGNQYYTQVANVPSSQISTSSASANAAVAVGNDGYWPGYTQTGYAGLSGTDKNSVGTTDFSNTAGGNSYYSQVGYVPSTQTSTGGSTSGANQQSYGSNIAVGVGNADSTANNIAASGGTGALSYANSNSASAASTAATSYLSTPSSGYQAAGATGNSGNLLSTTALLDAVTGIASSVNLSASKPTECKALVQSFQDVVNLLMQIIKLLLSSVAAL